MRGRLSVLMFLQYAVCGAWVPLFSLILQKLDFTPTEIAWACATAALGALLAPLPWGQIADRWVPAQHCISFCALVAGVLLWVLSELTTPWPVFLTTLGFWFFMVPVISLGTSLTFRHLQHPEREFGPVRMWGTIGWVGANWFLTFWFAAFLSGDGSLADAFRLGGSLAFVLTLYAWTLPHTPPSTRRMELAAARRSGWLWSALEAPLLAMRLFRQRAFLIYCVCLMGLYITMPFSGQLTPLLLEALGVATPWLPATLTIAQSLEITTLGLLPIILLRLEIKGTLLLGMLAWAGALTVLTVGQPLGLVIPSLGLHGIYITCFLVAGQVFVNRRAQQDIRASAQALLQFLNGVGMLFGNLLVGAIRALAPDRFMPSFAVAAALAGTLVVVFVVGFRTKAE
jgi:MFS family permease